MPLSKKAKSFLIQKTSVGPGLSTVLHHIQNSVAHLEEAREGLKRFTAENGPTSLSSFVADLWKSISGLNKILTFLPKATQNKAAAIEATLYATDDKSFSQDLKEVRDRLHALTDYVMSQKQPLGCKQEVIKASNLISEAMRKLQLLGEVLCH